MNDSATPELSVSIVSHGHVGEVRSLLADLRRVAPSGIETLLTLNSPEDSPLDAVALPGPGAIIRNIHPRGFGANHNAAFRRSRGRIFCVVNPDIRLLADPFGALRAALAGDGVGVAAPLVTDSAGSVQSSYRRVPTPARWLRHALGGMDDYDYTHPTAGEVDWCAGMFLAFRRQAFEALGGFDERYFLYYEDVDLCSRARLAGWKVRLASDARVIHDARRDSHRSPRYALWHARSVLRFWMSPVYRRACRLTAS